MSRQKFLLGGLNQTAALIHKANIDKGFWEEKRSMGETLVLVISEVIETLEADRKGRHADLTAFNREITNFGETTAFQMHVKDTVEDEIADSIIRLLDLSGYLGIDIETHIELKLRYNATRPKKHGKKY